MIEEDAKRLILRQLLESTEFARSPRQQKLLRFLFQRAIDEPGVPASRREILKEAFPKFISANSTTPRPQINRLKKTLDSYYDRNPQTDGLRVTIPEGRYLIEFVNQAPAASGTALERFWLPFTSERQPIRIVVKAKAMFRDAWPRRRTPRASGVPNIPTSTDPLNETYLPTGLIQGILTFTDFLRTRGASCFLESPDAVSPSTTSTIAIGTRSPLLPVPPEIALHTAYYGEEPGIITVGNFADHFEYPDGDALFNCYARIFFAPNRKRGATLQICAYHSVAVEAAAHFLTSGAGARKIQAKVKQSIENGLIPSGGEEIGLVLSIKCVLTDPKAIALKPGVPRHLLKIVSVNLKQLIQPEQPKAYVYNPDGHAVKD